MLASVLGIAVLPGVDRLYDFAEGAANKSLRYILDYVNEEERQVARQLRSLLHCVNGAATTRRILTPLGVAATA